jgi:hypothetical protein|tara:strand:- start:440 stop:631 length:192 start_codon:yes stop_codon:yes gene_type:complete
MEQEKQFWKSKKFWAASMAVLVPMLNHFLGWNMDHEAVTTVMTPMLAYVVGQGMADLGKNAKK